MNFSPTLFCWCLITSSQIDPKYEIPRGDLVLEVSSLNNLSQKVELHIMMQDTLGEGEFGKVVLAALNNFKGKPGEPVNLEILRVLHAVRI